MSKHFVYVFLWEFYSVWSYTFDFYPLWVFAYAVKNFLIKFSIYSWPFSQHHSFLFNFVFIFFNLLIIIGGQLLYNILVVFALSDQIRSVAQSCPTLCDLMNQSMPGLPVHHQLQEFTKTQVHRVSHAIQPSHPLSYPSPLAPNPSQHQSLFQWVNSSHEVTKVLEFQL